MNRKEEIRPLRWQLNRHQLYNLQILKSYLTANKAAFAGRSQDQIKSEITSHGWDPAVIDVAMEDY